MKYKTFRALAMIGGLVAAGGGLYAYTVHARQATAAAQKAEDERLYQQAQKRQARNAFIEHEATLSKPELRAPGQPLRPRDSQLLALADRAISGDKVKDVLPGTWKVNLYRDAGESHVNRLKIDLNRNEKWDEKWTFEGTGAARVVKREVAPADDEAYTQRWILNGEYWVPEGAAAAPAPAPAPIPAPAAALPAGAIALSDLDRRILDRVAANITGDKAKDALPGPAKVNLYRDAGHDRVNRLKIDLDRDGHDDEKWDFDDDGAVKRHVSPGDDDQYTEEYRLREGAWVRK